MTKAATHETAQAEPELEEEVVGEPGSAIGRNEWRWAARELRREAQGYRWRSRLAEIFETVGDLESAITKKQAQLTDATAEAAKLDEKVAAARDQAKQIVADAEGKARATLDQSAAALQQASDELDSIQEKRARKLAELEDADRRLRDTRKQLADLRKNLGGDEAPAA
jgi:chromosome segregation ATPase